MVKIKNIIVIIMLLISPALADRRDADTCAKNLPAKSRIIYTQAINRVIPGAVEQNKVMLQELVGELIGSGKITIDEAYPVAMTAADCLRKVSIGNKIIIQQKSP